MSGFNFVPSRQGFIDLRNEGFVQDACLSVAKEVAATAGGLCGMPFECDVRPGKARCHARATCRIGAGAYGGKKAWYSGAYSDAADAATKAAVNLGGQAIGNRRNRGSK